MNADAKTHSGYQLFLIGIAAIAVASQAHAAEMTTQGVGPEDPLIALGQMDAGRNHFFLNSDQDVEVIRFRSPRDIELCAGAPRIGRDGRAHQYPIKVTWDSETAVIQSGNCLSFDAQRAKVRAASPLPQDIVLEGSYRVSR